MPSLPGGSHGSVKEGTKEIDYLRCMNCDDYILLFIYVLPLADWNSPFHFFVVVDLAL